MIFVILLRRETAEECFWSFLFWGGVVFGGSFKVDRFGLWGVYGGVWL